MIKSRKVVIQLREVIHKSESTGRVTAAGSVSFCADCSSDVT